MLLRPHSEPSPLMFTKFQPPMWKKCKWSYYYPMFRLAFIVLEALLLLLNVYEYVQTVHLISIWLGLVFFSGKQLLIQLIVFVFVMESMYWHHNCLVAPVCIRYGLFCDQHIAGQTTQQYFCNSFVRKPVRCILTFIIATVHICTS